jgi:hypothetical protein
MVLKLPQRKSEKIMLIKSRTFLRLVKVVSVTQDFFFMEHFSLGQLTVRSVVKDLCFLSMRSI